MHYESPITEAKQIYTVLFRNGLFVHMCTCFGNFVINTNEQNIVRTDVGR